MKEIDVDELLDFCWRLLNDAYTESYGKGYKYGEPEFELVLSNEQLMALRKHSAKDATLINVYEIKDGTQERLFGHIVTQPRATPYIKAIIGVVSGGNRDVL